MEIPAIISAVKARCPSFGGRVAGAAEFAPLPEASNLAMPAAYVIPLDDDAGPIESQNGRRQLITDGVAVVVVVSNIADERGQGSITSVRALRAELWAALLGWAPAATYGPLSYDGGQLITIDRSRLYYQFEFSAQTEITEEDTWQGAVNAALPPFTGMHVDVDAIDPHDPNRGPSGPDGTLEASADIPLPQ